MLVFQHMRLGMRNFDRLHKPLEGNLVGIKDELSHFDHFPMVGNQIPPSFRTSNEGTNVKAVVEFVGFGQNGVRLWGWLDGCRDSVWIILVLFVGGQVVFAFKSILGQIDSIDDKVIQRKGRSGEQTGRRNLVGQKLRLIALQQLAQSTSTFTVASTVTVAAGYSTASSTTTSLTRSEQHRHDPETGSHQPSRHEKARKQEGFPRTAKPLAALLVVLDHHDAICWKYLLYSSN